MCLLNSLTGRHLIFGGNVLKIVTALLIGFLLPFLVLKVSWKLTRCDWRGKLEIFRDLCISKGLLCAMHFLIILHALWLMIVSGRRTPASLQIWVFLTMGTKFCAMYLLHLIISAVNLSLI